MKRKRKGENKYTSAKAASMRYATYLHKYQKTESWSDAESTKH